MNLYVETSALLRWLFSGDLAAPIESLLVSADALLASRLTLAESRRCLQRSAGLGQLSEAAVTKARVALERTLLQVAVCDITAQVWQRSEQVFPAEPVRTLDALHLATALALRQDLDDLQVLSVDARVRKNAALLGLTVVP